MCFSLAELATNITVSGDAADDTVFLVSCLAPDCEDAVCCDDAADSDDEANEAAETTALLASASVNALLPAI